MFLTKILELRADMKSFSLFFTCILFFLVRSFALQQLDRSTLNFDRHLEFQSEAHFALLSDFSFLCAPREFETFQAEAILFFI